MANWAIVIGINEYWQEEKNLNGAIDDALRMTAWLIDPEGGNVPPENLYLLTNPIITNPLKTPDGTLLPTGIIKTGADSSTLNTTIYDMKFNRGATGDRFFFYFSGHGLTNPEDLSDEQAIIMANFAPGNETAALTIRSIGECFSGQRFDEQFFFIDACRNVLPWTWQFRVGEIAAGGSPSPNFTPTQYWLNANRPAFKIR